MSAKELSEWVEFYNLEPWGFEADCLKAGIVAATIANVHRDSKKKRTPFEATDFIPGYQKKPAKMDPKLLKSQLRLAFAGGLDGRNNNKDRGSPGDGKGPEDARGPDRSQRGKQRTTGGRKTSSSRGKATGTKK